LALGLPSATTLPSLTLAQNVAVAESALSLVEHVERFGLVGFHGRDRLHEHRLGLIGRAEACLLSEGHWRERENCRRRGGDDDCAKHEILPTVP
jgi:hypothetical protein